MKHVTKMAIAIGTYLITINTPCTASYLFKQFPQLRDRIHHIAFCSLPTPLVKLDRLSEHCTSNIWIKRDDLTGSHLSDGTHLYGGNKPRKLEFLLADALKKNAHTVITYGGVGSNHALATALYTKALGLTAKLFLTDQPNSHAVRRNLLLNHHYGAQLYFFSDRASRNATAQHLLEEDNGVYLIPVGGSNKIGALGYVNAAFELAEQINSGYMPEPDRIYLAAGSCGTTAGLLVGLQLANIQSKVIAVAVEPEDTPDWILNTVKDLFNQVINMLHDADPSIPLISFPEDKLIVNKKFCGTEYGLYTPEAMSALALLKETENIMLDGTYTSRPIAAILNDIAHPDMCNTTILFWNTYCSLDFSSLTKTTDYKQLPAELHRYFEQPVQPLDAIK